MANTAQAESSLPQIDRFELPLLTDGVAQQPGHTARILDFGPVQNRLVENLQKSKGGRLHVLDLQTEEITSEAWLDRIDHQPGWPDGSRCDLVLSWDYLNYLDTADLQRLNSKLLEVAHSGTRLHALIHYAKPEMPARPDRYSLLDDGRIERRSADTMQVKAPRYSPKALEKWMPGFKVDRTRLLGNGMQEFLLRCSLEDSA